MWKKDGGFIYTEPEVIGFSAEKLIEYGFDMEEIEKGTFNFPYELI
jgi:hypothetical protein